MPGSQWSSRGSSRAGSAPGSGEVTRVSSASSVVQVSSTEVSRVSSSSSLGRVLRSRSGSSAGSIPFPRYSPIDGGGIFKPARTVTPRTHTPNGYHILNCYDPRTPAFSPVLPATHEEGTCSGAVSRTSSAGLELPRAPSRLSRVSSAADLSRVTSAGSIDLTLPPVVFEDSLASSVAVSRLSSAGVGSATADALHRTSSNEAVSRHSSVGSIDWALVPPVPLMRSNSRRGTARMRCTASDSDGPLSRTGSAEAEALGPDGRLLADVAKKVAVHASRRRRK